MRYKYSKYRGDPLEDVSIEDLLAKLSDLLMSSGFEDPYDSLNDEQSQSLESLNDDILEALLNGGLLSDDAIQRLTGEPVDRAGRSQLEELVNRLIEALTEQGYITTPEGSPDGRGRELGDEGHGANSPRVRFEVTDKSLDFLGYRALRDLLGSLGKSSVGRHDTRDFSTGVEASGTSKPWQFGDTMNLDPSATILNAVQRAGSLQALAGTQNGPGSGLDVNYDDLVVVQGEYQSSCATVLMLDCSHSMILYGEDRFTPAKRVAMALANLIRHQYPGDALNVVLFHDTAEEIPLKQLPRVRVGPHYTNTRDGLQLARRILERQRKDMRQIIMITDGKPSAITRADGRIYRNAFGLDPHIVQETFAEVAACRRANIMINTFMLARDYDLVAFVRRVAEICHGKAYFTTPRTLGQYVLLDYLTKKTRTVH
ncbi:MAG: VWA domain-containing protein [Vicinamibacterales bacterium]